MTFPAFFPPFLFGFPCSLALLVEFDDVFIAQLVDGHLDHAYRSVNDLCAGSDYRRSLLSLQHGCRYLFRVRDVRDADFFDHETGESDLLSEFYFHLFCNLLRASAESLLSFA